MLADLVHLAARLRRRRHGLVFGLLAMGDRARLPVDAGSSTSPSASWASSARACSSLLTVQYGVPLLDRRWRSALVARRRCTARSSSSP